MNEAKRQEYLKKYIRTGSDVILPKEKNPFPQMKTDTFKLDVTPDFGGFGGNVIWTSIFEPVAMQPEPAVSEHSRYISCFGGIPTDFTKLHGEVEITLGASSSDMKMFKIAEPFSAYIKKGMLYSISITKLNDPRLPVYYSELIFGEKAPVTDRFTDDDIAGFEQYIKTGTSIVANYPGKEQVPCPIMIMDNSLFTSNDIIRRTWMPITKAHIMAKNSHTHAFTEFLVCHGSDPENINDLGGVIEFTIGDSPETLETFRIDKATQFMLPPNFWHSPLIFREVNDPEKPMIFCEVSYAEDLVQNATLDNFVTEDALIPAEGDYTW